ncbi:hypothetical protein PILCRDRAFT_790992 [Piloderma croceum F 1598]|uniref:Protein kinase domain-containing protein n=1 Tax=Piloderma croceum (strain F 1598) TaxID=765440 RepID=A0A0C3FIN4_PILCF|nr:hypothetical protein PILCRDRAFT_790992 [Piloderma croceum F 1598]
MVLPLLTYLGIHRKVSSDLDLTKHVEIYNPGSNIGIINYTDAAHTYSATQHQEPNVRETILRYCLGRLRLSKWLGIFVQNDITYIRALRSPLPRVKVEAKVVKCFRNPVWRSYASGSENARARLIEHGMIWHRLDHPNVSKFYGLYFHRHPNLKLSPEPFLVMQDCGIIDVASYAQSKNNYKKLDLLRQIAKGLAYLHSRCSPIIHGNLCSDNVMVDVSGRPRICEYDLVRVLEYNPEPNHRYIDGRARWIAPELLFRGDDDPYWSVLTRETDVYAFAMIAIEIFTGKVPFNDLHQEHLVYLAVVERHAWPELPSFLDRNEKLRKLMHSCWSRDPRARPSAKDVGTFCTRVMGRYFGWQSLVGVYPYGVDAGTSSC